MEKKKEFIINFLYAAIIAGLIYFGINYVLGIVLPFILGFIFAYLAIKACRRFFHQEKTIYRTLTLLLIYFIIVLLIITLVNLGINKIGDFIKTLPNFYKNTIEPYITSLENVLMKYGESLPGNINNILSDITGDLFDTLKSILSSLVSGLVNITTTAISSAPNILIGVIATIVTSFYFVTDYDKIAGWFTSVLPDKYLKLFYEIKDFVENTLLKVLSAYASIMLVTFIELLIGLTIFKVSNSAMWAFIIALLDIFPVLGVGTVLVPWGVSSLITGNFVLGIELLVLYLIISFVRNIIEPKFVGTNLGLHPLVILFSIIVGVRLFGAIGMFGLPLTLSFFVNRPNNKDVKKTDKPSKKNNKASNKK